jgi:wobble nucleotide-excising tRNase
MLPTVPEKLAEILATTLESVSVEAESQVARHLEAHQGMGFETWTEEGLGFVSDDTCPFCQQAIPSDSIRLALQSGEVREPAWGPIQK